MSADLFSIPESDSSPVTRMTTFILAIFCLYPQYRAFKTVLIGRGWISGDWEKEHRYNKRNLCVIEPLVESLLQVDLGSVEHFQDTVIFQFDFIAIFSFDSTRILREWFLLIIMSSDHFKIR